MTKSRAFLLKTNILLCFMCYNKNIQTELADKPNFFNIFAGQKDLKQTSIENGTYRYIVAPLS